MRAIPPSGRAGYRSSRTSSTNWKRSTDRANSMAPRKKDREANRFSARAKRYARVGANVGGVAARMAGARFFGFDLDRAQNAIELTAALGGLKGPIMKVAE